MEMAYQLCVWRESTGYLVHVMNPQRITEQWLWGQLNDKPVLRTTTETDALTSLSSDHRSYLVFVTKFAGIPGTTVWDLDGHTCNADYDADVKRTSQSPREHGIVVTLR